MSTLRAPESAAGPLGEQSNLYVLEPAGFPLTYNPDN